MHRRKAKPGQDAKLAHPVNDGLNAHFILMTFINQSVATDEQFANVEPLEFRNDCSGLRE